MTEKEVIVRTVGHRKEQLITFSASAELLVEGVRFNDEIHRLPSGKLTFMPKGVYRFKTHEEANRFDFECLTEGMARIALVRRDADSMCIDSGGTT